MENVKFLLTHAQTKRLRPLFYQALAEKNGGRPACVFFQIFENDFANAKAVGGLIENEYAVRIAAILQERLDKMEGEKNENDKESSCPNGHGGIFVVQKRLHGR